MLNVPAFAAPKEHSPDAFIHLLEIEYSDGQFVRYARYDTPVKFQGEIYTPFPMSKPVRSQSTNGQIPAYDIAISGVGREIASILETFEIELRPGRTIKVHPSAGVQSRAPWGGPQTSPILPLSPGMLTIADSTAMVESPFTVVRARIRGRDATITLSPVAFDPLGVLLPRKKVSSKEFPGILNAAGRF